jgi:hypothetical protein
MAAELDTESCDISVSDMEDNLSLSNTILSNRESKKGSSDKELYFNAAERNKNGIIE